MRKDRVLTRTAFVLTVVLVLSTIMFWRSDNTEFVYYNILFFLLVLGVRHYRQRLHFGAPVVLGLATLVLSHIIAGLVFVGGTRLYDITFGPFTYDNVQHLVMGAVFAFLAETFFAEAHTWKRENKPKFFLLVVLVTLGFGAVVEMAEYTAVEVLEAQGVGDYVNNARDLVFDLCGAMIGGLFMVCWKGSRGGRR